MFGPKKSWLAYEDGSYEPVDPRGNLNRKKRGPEREDWWVVQKDQRWSPPMGKQRPMNAPSKAKKEEHSTFVSRDHEVQRQKQREELARRARNGEIFVDGAPLPGEYPENGSKGRSSPVPDMLPRVGVFNQDPMGDKEAKGTQSKPGKSQSILSGLFNPDPGIIAKPIASSVPFTRDMIKYLDDQPDHSADPRRNQDAPRKSAHATARLTPVNAKGKPQVRLLEQGLDPEVAMVKGKGETMPVRNPYQDARDMEEQAQYASEQGEPQGGQVQTPEGGKEKEETGFPLPWIRGSKTIESKKGPLSGKDPIIRKAVETADKKGADQARKEMKHEIDTLEEEKHKLEGKARAKMQKRIDKLRGAWKVLPRFFPKNGGMLPPVLLVPEILLFPERYTDDSGYI